MEAFLKPFMEAGYTWVGREHWATGLMVGLTAPVALFLANPEWGVPEKLGYTLHFDLKFMLIRVRVFVGFAAVALKYGQQNKEEVTQYVKSQSHKELGKPHFLTLTDFGLVVPSRCSSWR